MKVLRFCCWFFPIFIVLFLYCLSFVVYLQISQPYWYKPYIHNKESPDNLHDHHFPRMFQAFERDYPFYHSPEKDFDLGYEQIEIETNEEWINIRTGKNEVMKLRGWYIGFNHIYNNITNKDRIISLLKNDIGLNDNEIQTQFHKHLENNKQDGIIGIHGAGVDRRELLRHCLFWLMNGYEILIADCRDHGLSDGYQRGPSFGLREHEDVASIINYALNTLEWNNFVIFGSSQGGSSTILGFHNAYQKAIMSGNNKPPVSCLIIENAFATKTTLWKAAINTVLQGKPFGRANATNHSLTLHLLQQYGGKLIPDFIIDIILEIVLYQLGYSSDRLDPIDIVDKLQDVEILYLHGEADTVVPISHSHELFNKTLIKNKIMKTFKGGKHASLSVQFPEDYMNTVGPFLQQCHSKNGNNKL